MFGTVSNHPLTRRLFVLCTNICITATHYSNISEFLHFGGTLFHGICYNSAFIYATGALGPVVGYALGALLLQFYVDVFSYKVDLSPAHPRWIGAWWGGFIICGAMLFTIAVPFLMFPQVLVEEKRKVLESKAREDLLSPNTTDSQTRSEDYGKDAKGNL